MTKLPLGRIADMSLSGRDLLIDELTDEIEKGGLSISEIEELINELALLLRIEIDYSVMESIFNFLGSAFERVGAQEGALHVIVSLLNRLPSGCLVHAIPIIAGSDLQDRVELLSPFLVSSNIAIRKVAEESLRF